jgi:hypothetical protein
VVVEPFDPGQQRPADAVERIVLVAAVAVLCCWTRRRTSSIAALASLTTWKQSATSWALSNPTRRSVTAVR